ncbi:MAG: phospho-N-acetylmuramoyl-pentapeptide-transferase [Trueperaceae bacterium]
MIVLITSFVSLLCVGIFLQLANHYGWGKPIRKAGPQSHLVKEGTPTMGGLAFLVAALSVWLFLPKTNDGYALVLLTLTAGLIGWWDDILSLQRKKKVALGEDASTGLLARYRLLGQGIVAFAFAIYATRTGHTLFNLTFLDLLVFALVIMGAINAVNFSDGLDGLAGGMMVIMLLPFTSLPFVLPMMGALLGFLWYNSKPARVFMGGVGSESLGAMLAGVAILSDWVWYLPLIALIPVLEVLSVMIQVIYFRATGGKRFFKTAPIHHHFELSSWSEEQIVTRFWLVTAVCVATAWALKGGS